MGNNISGSYSLLHQSLGNFELKQAVKFISYIESVHEGLSVEISTVVADTGYYSENNITGYQQKYISQIISTSREKHNSFLSNILNPDPIDDAVCVTPEEKMTRKLKSEEGKEIYRKRKQTIEPVFRIIKEIMGFRRFSLRGEAKTDAEWSLVCSAYNLKRFFKMQMA